MKKYFFSYYSILLAVFCLAQSCSDEFINPPELDENFSSDQRNIELPNPNESDKTVSYFLEGDFSGKLDVTFLSSEGFTPPDQIIGVKIPWEISYSIPQNTQAVGGYANGLYGDGQEGDSVSLKMFLDERLIETVIRKADIEGKVTLPLESYVLEYDNPDGVALETNVGKEVSYKINGDFSGGLTLIYNVADGSHENIQITELPWEYSFTTTQQSLEASIYGFGNQGIEGEEIEYNLIIDGSVIQSETVVVDNEGKIGLFPELYHDFD